MGSYNRWGNNLNDTCCKFFSLVLVEKERCANLSGLSIVSASLLVRGLWTSTQHRYEYNLGLLVYTRCLFHHDRPRCRQKESRTSYTNRQSALHGTDASCVRDTQDNRGVGSVRIRLESRGMREERG